MEQNPITPGTQTSAARKSPHPMFLIAAASVAAVAVIAGAQMLRSGGTADAKNASAATTASTAAATNAAATSPAPSPAAAPAAPAPVAKTTKAPAPQVATAACATCGVVVAVREVRQTGEGTGVGAVAGGVVGGVVGHQFGGGHGKDALTIAGAVGGAIAGHQIEKQARASTSWHVDVRMNDGTTRTFTYASQPAFAAGEKVEVRSGQLAARG